MIRVNVPCAPLIALRRAAGLYNSTPKEMLEQFATVSNEDGLVTEESYVVFEFSSLCPSFCHNRVRY